MANHKCFPDLTIHRSSERVGRVLHEDVVVYDGLPKAVEHTPETLRSIKDFDESKYRFFECLEGTIVLVFSYADEWYTTTTKRLTAFNRFNGRDTLGLEFARALSDKLGYPITNSRETMHELYRQNFKPDRMYVFSLNLDPDEDISADREADRDVVFLGTVASGCVSVVHANDSDELPKLPRRREFETLLDATNYVSGSSDDRCVISLNDSSAVKIMSPERVAIRNIRGSTTASLRYRYLELRNTKSKDLPAFFSYYPEMEQTSADLEEQIYALAKYLHSKYLRIFVNNESGLYCSKEERFVLYAIHKRYLATKQRTTPSRINDILANIHPARLNRLLRKRPAPEDVSSL